MFSTKRFWFNYGDTIKRKAKNTIPYIASIALFATIVAVTVVIYTATTTLHIVGHIYHPKSQRVYLAQFLNGERVVTDSTSLSSIGEFSFRIKNISKTPMIYEIINNNEVIPIMGEVGQKIEIEATANPIYSNYQVTGSKDSKLLKDHYKRFTERVEQLQLIAASYATAIPANSRTKKGTEGQVTRQSLEEQYNKTYGEIKELQSEFITNNSDHIAAIYALSLRVPGEEFLFSEELDTTYMRLVKRDVTKAHPEAECLKYVELMLENEILRIEHERLMKIENIGVKNPTNR